MRDKHAHVKLMKNINKPLPNGVVALPTSETGWRKEKEREKKKKKKEIQIRTYVLPNSTLNASLTHIIQYNILSLTEAEDDT